MASTYSPSLKITLMGDGDQAGLWGQTTNTNLGTLIEQAITGVVSITMSNANYTLSNFNGVSDEARNAVLVVSGSNSAVRDVIPPVVKKLYTVVNNTSGGFAIRVIGATGTGVTIPNGATCFVYCDGVNFVNGLSGTSGNFTVNGSTVTTTLTVSGAAAFNSTTTAPTESYPDNTTKVATTAYVTTALNNFATALIPSGSVFLLYQASAPTGWTQVTTAGLDDSALRIVTSTGGSTGGTSAFSTVFTNQTPTITTSGLSIGATTLSSTQIPSHQHSIPIRGAGGDDSANIPASSNTGGTDYPNNITGATGGGGSHTHSISGSATSSAITLNVKYINIILCSKN